jgi:Xaa-Pro aminopeptidase
VDKAKVLGEKDRNFFFSVKILSKVEKLKQLAFKEKGFDAFLITDQINMLYLSGFPGAACLLLHRNGDDMLYVYNVNYEQAKEEVKDFHVVLVKRSEDLMKEVASCITNLRIGKVAVDVLSYENYRSLADSLRSRAMLKMQGKLLWELRKVKDKAEIELMRKAGELTSKGIKTAYETIRPGVREYEVAAEIEYAMRKCGSCGTAFDTIVASGSRSAFPHGGCTDREIQEGDLVVVDVGAVYRYYRSDMTRTVVAGRPSEKQQKIFEIVREAQARAYEAVMAEVTAKYLDGIARKIIEDAGYGKFYVHGLGHGVGLEVHETPTLNQESNDKLVVGNVVTIEPGIYLPGFGGVRIEDTVLVQKGKAEKLTKGPYVLHTQL